MSQGPERLAAEFLRSQPVFRSSDIAVRTVRGLLHFLGTRGLLSVDAPPGPWRVERDQNADVVTPPVYRVHWSSRVKFETTSIHEAAAVRDALNRLAAAAGVSLPDSGDAPPALRVERDATWEGGWVLHFPTESIAIATFEREQGRAALGSAPRTVPSGPWRIHVHEFEEEGFLAKIEYTYFVVRGAGKPQCIPCHTEATTFDEAVFNSGNKAEAEAVRDALNRVGSAPRPEAK